MNTDKPINGKESWQKVTNILASDSIFAAYFLPTKIFESVYSYFWRVTTNFFVPTNIFADYDQPY